MRMMQRRTASIALVAVLLASIGPKSALAQTSADDKVAAEALFDSGKKLIGEGKFAEACAKFEQSQRLDPGIGTLLYLGDCYERAGRYASAWATFRDGASQAHEAGQHDRARAGEDRAAALEPRLSKLTIKVSAEAQAIKGLSITRGPVGVAKSLWGVAVPVDGGNYEIRAAAPGMKTWSNSVSVPAEKGNSSIDVPALEADPDAVATEPTTPAPLPTPSTAPTPAPAPNGPQPERERSGSGQRTIGFVFGGVGLVGLGIGSYFGLRAISKNSDAKGLCDGTVCRDQQGVDLTNQAKSAATISNLAFTGGLGLLAAGIVLYATAPTDERPPSARRRAPLTAIRVAPMVAPGLASVTLGGRF